MLPPPTPSLPLEDGATLAPNEPGSGVSAGSAAGRYTLLDEIACGGMGVVYRATDTVLGREIAVKVLQERYTADPTVAWRFLEEARITGQLQHPGIPAVHDLGTLADGRPFLAMKLIKGQTLQEQLNHRATPEQNRGHFLAVFEQICQAVGYAHAHGAIHRDLKPSNVMVGAFGEVQVMDWGLAKLLTERRPPQSDVTEDVSTAAGTAIQSMREVDEATRAGSVLGTPAYMPPEQAIGAVDQIDARSDVFGLGAILCVLLTGKPPYRGPDAEALRQLAARAKLDDAFGRLDACGAEPELVALCKRCLAAEKADRPGDAREVAAAVAALRAAADERARQAELERVRAEEQRNLERVRAEEQRKRRRVQGTLALSVLGLAATAAVGVVLAFFWRSAERAKENAVSANKEAVKAKEVAEVASKEAVKAKEVAEEAGAAEKRARQDAVTVQLLAEAAEKKLAGVEYGRTMQLAYQEWRDNKVGASLALLASTRPGLRGWEWHYVRRLCHSDLLTLRGHQHHLHSASFSADGTRIVTASIDQTAKVWDAQTGIAIRTLKGHTNEVRSASFSADGTRIVTASGDGTAKVWDAQAGTEILTLKGHNGFVQWASFSPDGTRIVTAGADSTVKVWDAKTGTETRTLTGHKNGVTSASYSADGTRIVTASGDKTAKVWDAQTGTETLTLRGHKDVVWSASFSADGTRILTASTDDTVKVWDAKSGTETLTLKGNGVLSASFSPDGTRIVTANMDQTAKVWDAKSGTETRTLRGHTDVVLSASFSRDGRRIVTASYDFTAKVWDAQAGTDTVTLEGHKRDVESASFSPDGTRIVTASWDGTAKVWDAQTGTGTLTLRGHTHALTSASFSPDGTRIITASNDWTAKVWDAKTGTETLTLKGHTISVRSASFSPDGTRIVTASHDRTVKVWDTRPVQPLPRLRGLALGDVLRATGDLDGAIDAYKEAIRVSPKDSEAYNRLGLALKQKGDVDGAIAAYQEAIRLDPNNASAHFNLGFALESKGDLDRIIAAYKDAIRLNPRDTNAHNNLGWALQRKGNVDEAIAEYKEALRLDPKHSYASRNLPKAERLRELLFRLPDVLAGKAEPKTPAEGCEFADLCGQPFQKRYADAVRLYEKAFAAEPKLTDNPLAAHRYNAACYAVRAASGDGLGAPTEPQERAALREKALAWLQADLALWKNKAGSKEATDRQMAASKLAHWLMDTDLEETRPGAKREGWTEKESQAWDGFATF